MLMDDEESNPCDALSGLPQGSVLGPAHFLVHLSDVNY